MPRAPNAKSPIEAVFSGKAISALGYQLQLVVSLLTSEAGAKYNNRIGTVMATHTGIKQGRAAVLFDGGRKPISFKLMNLQIKM